MNSKGMTIGYARVSSEDQNEARQLVDVKLDRLFTDKCSGATTNRPALQEALAFVREGDCFMVHSMDRLSRNLTDLRTVVEGLTKRGVEVRFHQENLVFTGSDSPMANLMLSLLGAVSEFERACIRSRQAEGIREAKKRGVYKGRVFKLDAAGVAKLKERSEAGVKKVELMKEFNLSRQALYMYLNRRAA